MSDRIAGEAGGLMEVELVHETLPMLFDGLDAEIQDSCDLFVGMPLGDQLQGFLLPAGEIHRAPPEWPAPDVGYPVVFEQPPGNRWTEKRVAFVDFVHRLDYILGRGL